MTYLQFHLFFILPPILLLALLLRSRPVRLGPRAWWAIPAVMVIALVYTTPWDNYLVYREVWGYGPERVLGTIGFVPVEEYAFFLLQPLLTGLWLYLVLARVRPGISEVRRPRRTRWMGAALWAAVALCGVVFLSVPWGEYMGLILAWSAPVIALQWAYAGPGIRRYGRAALLGVAVPTLYLWVADAAALGMGIWHISPDHTTGIMLGNLPIEEATFFLVTNVLVVFGVLLFLAPWKLEGTRW